MEDIVDGMVKIDAMFSDKEELPVVFVASDLRALTALKMKDVESSSNKIMESRVKIEERVMTMTQISNDKISYRQEVISQQRQPCTTREILNPGHSRISQIQSSEPQPWKQAEGILHVKQLPTYEVSNSVNTDTITAVRDD